jgi:hypothetical protein
MQAEQFKIKYNEVFRNKNHQQKFSLPLHSPLSKDINKISDLISG